MPTVPFTTRIDADLKAKLEQLARFEDRSASTIANQAIQHFVEERAATRALVDLGVETVARGASGIDAETIHDWMLADGERPFPSSRS